MKMKNAGREFTTMALWRMLVYRPIDTMWQGEKIVGKGKGKTHGRADIPTNPSIVAHSTSQEIGICPALAKTPKELARTMAQIMVKTPTQRARATLTFSIREIWRFHRRRTGMAITMKALLERFSAP
jgi:hypothetical protein